MDKGLEKILRNGFTYDERRNSYNGTVRIVGIDWKDDLEQKLREYFRRFKLSDQKVIDDEWGEGNIGDIRRQEEREKA